MAFLTVVMRRSTTDAWKSFSSFVGRGAPPPRPLRRRQGTRRGTARMVSSEAERFMSVARSFPRTDMTPNCYIPYSFNGGQAHTTHTGARLLPVS